MRLVADGGEDAEGSASVDWDSEWKKVSVKASEESSLREQPRGLDDMSEIERNTVRATRRVSNLGQQAVKKAEDLTKQPPKVKVPKVKVPKVKVKVPTWKRASKDWRFWLGLLVVLSFGTQLLTALTQNGGDDLFV